MEYWSLADWSVRVKRRTEQSVYHEQRQNEKLTIIVSVISEMPAHTLIQIRACSVTCIDVELS
jgi:hypothetical protein